MAIINKIAVQETVKAAKPQTVRQFIGKGWVNLINKPGNKYNGVKYVNITLDNTIGDITIKNGEKLILFPNKKRAGKKDADFRLSVVSNETSNPDALDVEPF